MDLGAVSPVLDTAILSCSLTRHGVERRTTMKGNASLLAKVAGLSVAAALLASCYSQFADQNGSFTITARPAPAGSAVVVLVVNASYENTLKDMFFLIDKGKQFPGTLTGSDL